MRKYDALIIQNEKFFLTMILFIKSGIQMNVVGFEVRGEWSTF